MTTTVEAAWDAGPQIVVDLVWRPHRPISALTDQHLADQLQDVQRQRARLAAEEAELILALATVRPSSADPQPGEPGARRAGWSAEELAEGYSEFLPAELSAIINLGRGTAASRLSRAVTWRGSLPGVFAALASGDLDERRANAFADELAHSPTDVAARIEAELLAEATHLSVYRLVERIRALTLQLDEDAAEQARRQAARHADVHVHPAGAPGRSTLSADLPTEEAVECYDLIDRIAAMLKADGDPRPIGALRAYVLAALIRRPADHGLPMVTANVTVSAALTALEGGSTPGEVNGLAITATHLRELLTRLGALGVTTPDGGTMSFAITGPDGRLLATLTPAELQRLARRGCTEHPTTATAAEAAGVGVDAGSAAVADCTCPITGPPPETDAYTPTDRQRTFIRTRDERCRFPNCGQRVGATDLDHVIDHARGGATDCTNLCCVCRAHHRVKTFAPGWAFTMTDDGTLTVTTPSGVTRTTRPPGLRPAAPRSPDPRPPGVDPSGTGIPLPDAPPRDDDPPPF